MIADDELRSQFGRRFLKTKHRIHETKLFTDKALANLIDSYPRSRLLAFTMGADPERIHELVPVDTAGVSGEQAMRAVAAGKLWFKLLRIHLHDGPYAALVADMHEDLAAACPSFRPLSYSAVVLIGSTNSQVYFHLDAKPNMLWHIRGHKRFWLYPTPTSAAASLVSQNLVEDIFENVQDEEVPFQTDFDRYSQVFDLLPGDLLSWPQNSPHRVDVVAGVSVSISSFYETDQSVRRGHVYGANRILRRTFGVNNPSTKERGFVPFLKSNGYRALRRMQLIQHHPNRKYETDLRIDAAAPGGVSHIAAGKVVTEFGKGDGS